MQPFPAVPSCHPAVLTLKLRLGDIGFVFTAREGRKETQGKAKKGQVHRQIIELSDCLFQVSLDLPFQPWGIVADAMEYIDQQPA